MKRPSFQFYPGDWSGNSNLRRCTHAEKGAWLDVMCLMHDQEEYGVLRWPLKEIAQAVGCPVSLLKGLVAKGVLKGSDKELDDAFVYVPRSGRKDGQPVELVAGQAGPIWYSSRMVKDEYVRTIRGESSRFGESPKNTPKQSPKVDTKASPKPPFGDGSSSSSSSSSSIKDKSSLIATEENGEAPAHPPTASESPEKPYGDPRPAGELAKVLRGLGVQVTPANPDFRQWVDSGLTADEATAGVDIARNAKPAPEPIPWQYLAKVLATQRKSSNGTVQPQAIAEPAWEGDV